MEESTRRVGQWSWWPVVEIAGWASAGLLILIAVIVGVVLVVRRRQQSQEARAARALLGVSSRPGGELTPSTSVPSCVSSMSGDAMAALEINHQGNIPSLAKSPSVPCCVRFMYPIFTLLCCGLFVLADLLETARVNVDLLVSGAPHHSEWEWSGTMASLTLLKAAQDAWRADARATSIVLFFLNGIWPFLQTGVLLPPDANTASWKLLMLAFDAQWIH